MAQALRPAASEVRSMLLKIKRDNMANGRVIAAAASAGRPGPGQSDDGDAWVAWGRRLELQSILWLE